MDDKAKLNSLMFGDTAEARAFRVEQAHVDSDIEGLPRDPDVDAFVAGLDAEDLTFEERKARLDDYFNKKHRPQGSPDFVAAE